MQGKSILNTLTFQWIIFSTKQKNILTSLVPLENLPLTISIFKTKLINVETGNKASQLQSNDFKELFAIFFVTSINRHFYKRIELVHALIMSIVSLKLLKN